MRQQNGSSDGIAEGVHGHPQPKNYLRPCLLLLLGEEPAYGYELREKLAPMSPSPWDMGTVYRALNNMEEDGLVVSSWERSAEGPRRRRYDITGALDEIWQAVRRLNQHVEQSAPWELAKDEAKSAELHFALLVVGNAEHVGETAVARRDG